MSPEVANVFNASVHQESKEALLSCLPLGCEDSFSFSPSKGLRCEVTWDSRQLRVTNLAWDGRS